MKHISLFLLSFFVCFFLNAQEKKVYKIHTVAFYNLENLFDTINDLTKFDEASPMMEIKTKRHEIYKKKVSNMARVISEIGLDLTNNSPAIAGVSEVENRDVLDDLVNDSLLIRKDYGIIHYSSPDARGIDVALLYQKELFTPISSSSHEVNIYDDDSQKRIYTRDQLLVSGNLDGEYMHIIVNHWPSRSGGEARSKYKRIAAAKLTKHLIDSLQAIDPYSKVIIMGDFNDNPKNTSIKTVLKTEKNKSRVGFKGIYNPYERILKKGIGTTAYRDNWSLFDQIFLTKPFLVNDYNSFQFYKAGIFNKQYLITKTGVYKGYPYRSWGYGGFTNGYSDHFPVYIYLVKKTNN